MGVKASSDTRTQSGFEFFCDFPHETGILCKQLNVAFISRIKKYWTVSIVLSV